MRILIIGDTHGHPYAVNKALEMTMPVDMLIHTGDGWNDVENIPDKVELVRVTGNCDRSIKGASERILEMNGHRILIVHGHKCNVNCNLKCLYYKAIEAKADIVIFGHSHKRVSEQIGKLLFINPGSAWRPKNCEPPGFVLMNMTDENTIYGFIDLAKRRS